MVASTRLRKIWSRTSMRKPSKERRALASALYLNRAAARLELKEFKGALSDCDEVLESEPRHAKALYRRGRCCLEMDDWPAAKKAFASVLEVDASE